MTTPPAQTEISKAESWLKQHERIVLTTLVLAATLFVGNKYIDYVADRDSRIANVAAQQAQAAQTAAQQAAQVYQQTIQQQQAKISVLIAEINQRNSALIQQQAQIKTAPLTDVAKQWQQQIGGEGDITNTGVGLSVSDSGARRTVSNLLELPVVKSNLDDETKIANSKQTQLDAANTSISALNAQVKADDAACKAQIAQVKAESRKSKRNWFIAGTVIGGLARALVHAYVGI
ncbi:MAG: hypothetical protein C5B59_08535 [Bacteroidetes bacterium]|nr:MAG: hypothetical protein C5B59_08535 [Bacteroidota bacterium]